MIRLVKTLTITRSLFQKIITGFMVVAGFAMIFFSSSKGSVVTRMTGSGGIAHADVPGSGGSGTSSTNATSSSTSSDSSGGSDGSAGSGDSSGGCGGCGCSSG